MGAAGLSTRLAGRLARGRAMAESRMLSRATVRRKTGETVPDPDDPEYEVDEWVVVATGVPFRLKDVGGSRGVTIGSAVFEEADGIGNLPASHRDLRDDDAIDVTSGEWPGAAWNVDKAIKSDQATARRFPVSEMPRPRQWD